MATVAVDNFVCVPKTSRSIYQFPIGARPSPAYRMCCGPAERTNIRNALPTSQRERSQRAWREQEERHETQYFILIELDPCHMHMCDSARHSR